MSAIERCRTAALGGHVERCEACAHLRISYNSCRDRHCPKCQAVAAKQWLADRQAELLPVPYFHVVFTLPRPIADIAYQNKAVVYDLLLKPAAETLMTIAADPSTSARASGSPPCCTPGDRRSLIIRTPISSYRGRLLARRPALDCLPARLLSVCPSALPLLPSPVPGNACRRVPGRATGVLRRSGRRPSEHASKPTLPHCERSNGWSMPDTFWRNRCRPRLPVPLHAPGCYCQ